jgi:hypothetical protein
MPHPIAFSDAQITAVLDAAKVLAPDVRAAFLEAVVEALQGSDVGDGQVYRAIRAAQQRFLVPPRWGTL